MPSSRKLDARHKIQLGGIVIASGVRDVLGLSGDLQRDPKQAEGVAVLAGALDYVRELLLSQQGEAARRAFLERGRVAILASSNNSPLRAADRKVDESP